MPASDLAGSTTNPPTDTDDYTGLLSSIDASLKQMVAYAADTAWDPLTQNVSPYTVLQQAWATGTVKQEILLPVAARSLIIICDQIVTINLYDISMNGPDLTLQNGSGSLDYEIKSLSLWSLPKSRAIPKFYLTNKSGSTVNIQVLAWG